MHIYWKKILNYTCPEIKLGCVIIEGIKPQNYTLFEGKEMCVIRKWENYYDMVKSGKIIAKEKTCSETQKLCGIVDIFGRKLCVNQNEECPLNKNCIGKVYEEKPLNKFISKIYIDKNYISN